jgi:hypothetical protein
LCGREEVGVDPSRIFKNEADRLSPGCGLLVGWQEVECDPEDGSQENRVPEKISRSQISKQEWQTYAVLPANISTPMTHKKKAERWKGI